MTSESDLPPGLDDLDDDYDDRDLDDMDLDDELDGDAFDMDDETRERMAAVETEMRETRARLADVPAEVVVMNHAMGLYELAAIHLSAQPPSLPNAALAIDAFACLVEGLGERMGPEIATMRDALSQIRLAFVQIKGTAG